MTIRGMDFKKKKRVVIQDRVVLADPSCHGQYQLYQDGTAGKGAL